MIGDCCTAHGGVEAKKEVPEEGVVRWIDLSEGAHDEPAGGVSARDA